MLNQKKCMLLLLVSGSGMILPNFLMASPPTVALNKQQQEILFLHNKIRTQHQAANLIWDNALAHYAEQYAAKCEFKHSGSPYGENLAAGYPSIRANIDAWYQERKYYSYTHPGFSVKTGHFTQLIWQASKKLGCGFAACNGKNGTPGNYLVCEYSPAGNVTNQGYFKENVA
jgi:uncharacterized protein YkwD